MINPKQHQQTVGLEAILTAPLDFLLFCCWIFFCSICVQIDTAGKLTVCPSLWWQLDRWLICRCGAHKTSNNDLWWIEIYPKSFYENIMGLFLLCCNLWSNLCRMVLCILARKQQTLCPTKLSHPAQTPPWIHNHQKILLNLTFRKIYIYTLQIF